MYDESAIAAWSGNVLVIGKLGDEPTGLCVKRFRGTEAKYYEKEFIRRGRLGHFDPDYGLQLNK